MKSDPGTDCGIAGRATDALEIIPLNLVVDYPVRWSRFKVLRDFLQNFYDALGCQAWQKRFSASL
jgi:hypothetical protein